VVTARAAGGPVSVDSDEEFAEDPLTTKEGWRRFVERQASPPVLHDAATLARLSAGEREQYDEARRD
jgi:hypothetical protein